MDFSTEKSAFLATKPAFLTEMLVFRALKGLSHEMDLKNFDQNLKNLALLRDATGV